MRPINLWEEEALRRRRMSVRPADVAAAVAAAGVAASGGDPVAHLPYGQEIPAQEDYEEWRWAAAAAQVAGTATAGYYRGEAAGATGPPVLPPHLLQVNTANYNPHPQISLSKDLITSPL